jgi:hypothetical protein
LKDKRINLRLGSKGVLTPYLAYDQKHKATVKLGLPKAAVKNIRQSSKEGPRQLRRRERRMINL